MIKEQITEKTILVSMEPSDKYGWGGCGDCPFKLVTLDSAGRIFGSWVDFENVFTARPNMAQVQAHEQMAERAVAKFWARAA